jgi:hypothetical protein
MAKSSKYTLDWSKLPEVHQDKMGYWWAGEWTFELEEEYDLESCEQAIYANLAWYLFVKEQQDVSTEA